MYQCIALNAGGPVGARTVLIGGCVRKSMGESSFSGNEQKPASDGE